MTAPADFHALHAAILGAPEDDAPRAALSSYLHAIDPDQSAFISMQLQRARRERRPDAFGHEPPSTTERALLARHEAAWTRLIAPHIARRRDGGPACTFHRGLVAHVVIDPEAFLAHAAELLVAAPIRHVDFAPLAPGTLPRLLASDALAGLDSIGFIDQRLDDDAVAAIAASPHLARCVYLDLSLNRLGPAAFAAIAASPRLRGALVVERSGGRGLDPALTWHPGEVVISEVAPAKARATLQPISPEGRALEARHGYLPWLHLDNRVSRFNARWFIDQGHLPITPTGTPTGTPVPA